VIVHLADVADVDRWARELPEGARRLAAAFWPGPLTLIVPRAEHVADAVTGGQDSVGLRMPSHPVARQLLAAFSALGGSGIAAPSANRFGHVSPTTAQHVVDDLGDAVAMILDGGACDVGIESTIVAFTGREPVLLRPGGVSVEDLVRILGKAPRASDAGAPRASGTLASHYAPQAPARLVAPAELLRTLARHNEWIESRFLRGLSTDRPILPVHGSRRPWLRLVTRTIFTRIYARSTRPASPRS
jgi:L-threonylcarbamoyladenylate synthase